MENEFIRKVDELERIVIPIEFRTLLGINERDELKISVKDNVIILLKNEVQ